MDKQKLIEQIIAQLNQEMASVMEAARAAHEAATHEESKAEDQYDTRGLEASYLAGAQAARVAELDKQITFYRFLKFREFKATDAVAPGALVELELGGKRVHYFLVQQGGGISLQFEGKTVHVITSLAPLGEALEGKKVGDDVEVEAQNAVREYRVIAVR